MDSRSVGGLGAGTPRLVWKRTFDIAASAVLLVVLSPLIAIVAVVVRRSLGSPVLFRQERSGRGGKSFTLYKFRTMRDGQGSDAERLTATGRTIRASSLDELPQLLNVLRGDMALVGPRPLLPRYLGRYNSRQARRLEVRPGITGLAQVRGRNALGWPERLEFDVQYVEGVSPLLDARILAETVASVVRRRGIAAEGQATMTEFMGSQEAE